MLFWWGSVVALCASAFGDGYTTQIGVKSGRLVETNPILNWLTRTNQPDALQTYGVGFSIIAGEILFGALVGYYTGWLIKPLLPWAALLQTGAHVYCIFHNYKLDTGKSLL